nr:GAF domain-containing protein [Thiorhodococcus minor]
MVIELEPAGPAVDLSVQIKGALDNVLSLDSVERLSDVSAAVFQELTGYDRVLIFRFDEAGYGQVIAERRKAGVASCLGQHFGDSEAPPNAHLLIERNRVRHLVDAHEPPVLVRPTGGADAALDLDLSRCTWRSFSPLHLQFLGRLGVRGTLVAPLSVGDRLWGLVVCHHRTPRFVHYPVRAACELLAETVATRITALEAAAETAAEARIRGVEARLIAAISRHGDWRPGLTDDGALLAGPIAATGAVVAYDGQIDTYGETPSEGRLREILEWLDARARKAVLAASVVGDEQASEGHLGPSAYALLAAPLSSADGEYLLWLRSAAAEGLGRHAGSASSTAFAAHPSQWLGHGSMGAAMLTTGRLLPRWSTLDRITARLLGEAVGDVIQQFRAVRVLIAQAQLAQAKSKLELASQPVLIADAQGAVLCTTPAWDATPGLAGKRLEVLQDLASLCIEAADVERHLRELVTLQRAWRGRIRLRGDDAATGRYLARADAVLAAPGRVLGLVVILTRTFEQAETQPSDPALGELAQGQAAGADAVSGRYSCISSLIADNRTQVARALTRQGDATEDAARCSGVERSATHALELLDRLIAYGRSGSRSRGRDAEE